MRIIQSSPPHTGSTVLCNLVTEFFEKGLPVHFEKEFILNNNRIVTKSHNINLNLWTQRFPEESLYFIVSTRDGDKYMQFDEQYKNWPNVLIFRYDELLITEKISLNYICRNVHKKISNFISFKGSSVEDLKTRFKGMNDCYEKIKDKPFSYIDDYYNLHGSHRDREPLSKQQIDNLLEYETRLKKTL